LTVPLFAIAPNIYVLGALGAISFLVGPIYNAVQFSYRISLIPDELQGRVNSAARMVIFGTIPLGLSLAGILLQAIGAIPTVLLFAAVEIALAIMTTFNRHIRAAKTIPDTLSA